LKYDENLILRLELLIIIERIEVIERHLKVDEVVDEVVDVF
jgi:hypothetical protein